MPTKTEYFVGWGTLALLNAGIAQAQGRSGLAWFLVSLFLGPFATLLIVASYQKGGGELALFKRKEKTTTE